MPECEKTMYAEVCKDRFDSHDGKLDQILTALKGNGDAGLCEIVRIHTTRLSAIEAEHKDVKQAMRGVVKWIVGIVGGSWLLAKSPEIIEWLKRML